MELISWLPWTMPGIVLAVGMLWAYLSIPGLSVFYGTLGILLIAFVMKGLPLGVRALSGTIVQVDRELEDCARVHGATWMQTFWSIMLYLIRPGMVAGGMLFAYITVRDLSTPVLLYGYGTEVLSIAMLQFWAESKPQIVSVLAVVMLLLLMILSGAQRWLLIKGEPLEESEAPVDKEVAGQLTGT